MLPLMLQVGFGFSPLQSGSLTFVSGIGSLAIRLVAAALLSRLGFRILLLGNAIICGMVISAFGLTQAGTPKWLVLVHVLVFGITRSIQFITTNTLTYADMSFADLSRGTSLGGVVQQLTLSLGVAIAATLLGWIAGPGELLTAGHFQLAFALVGLITLAFAPGFLLLRPEDGMHVSHHQRHSV